MPHPTKKSEQLTFCLLPRALMSAPRCPLFPNAPIVVGQLLPVILRTRPARAKIRR